MSNIVNHIDTGLDSLSAILGKVWGLPYMSLVALLCFAVGLFLRYQRRFPNEAIPFVVVIMGGVIAPLLADPRADSLPMRLWIGKNVVVGLFVGVCVWLGHKFVLKPIARKVAWLDWLAPAEGDTEFLSQPKPSKPEEGKPT